MERCPQDGHSNARLNLTRFAAGINWQVVPQSAEALGTCRAGKTYYQRLNESRQIYGIIVTCWS